MTKNNYKDLSIEELAEKILTEKQTLQRLKFNHAVTPLESPVQIRKTRRAIAQMKTELRTRQVNNK